MKKLAAPLLLAIAVTAVAYILFEAGVTRPGQGVGDIFFEVQKGEATRSVSRRLEAEGVVDSAQLFELEIRLRHPGAHVKAGEYKVKMDFSIRQVASLLVSGKVWERPVTIREGLTIWETALEMEKMGIVSAKAFQKASQELAIELKKEGFPGQSLEGYLFPETYSFPKSATARAVVKTMFQTFGKRAIQALPKELADNPRRLHEIVTLASIIEKETGAGFERPLISAVFHNRLRIRMPLQSDPTVIYSLPEFDGNLRRKDLQYDSPFNTYRYPGLPPGPIANPGVGSLVAAWRPAEADYLYFVSKNNGEHHFSRTLKEHNEAVLNFQVHRSGK